MPLKKAEAGTTFRENGVEVSAECRGTLFKEHLCPSESPLTSLQP
jgi:hypothetical protein